MITPAVKTDKRSKLKPIGLGLISFSVLVTSAVLASTGVPVPAILLLLGFNALLIFIGYRVPREGGFLLIVLSTLVLAWTSFMAIVDYDLAEEFRVLMTALAALYFVGALFVRFSSGPETGKIERNIDEALKTVLETPVKLATYDRVLIAIGLSLTGFIVFMIFWASHFR